MNQYNTSKNGKLTRREAIDKARPDAAKFFECEVDDPELKVTSVVADQQGSLGVIVQISFTYGEEENE